jgi:hypothetical protein
MQSIWPMHLLLAGFPSLIMAAPPKLVALRSKNKKTQSKRRKNCKAVLAGSAKRLISSRSHTEETARPFMRIATHKKTRNNNA